jgi:hypothetical protein
MKERLNLAALAGTMEELPRGDMHEVKGGLGWIAVPIVYIFESIAVEAGKAACDCKHIFCGLGLWLGPDSV